MKRFFFIISIICLFFFSCQKDSFHFEKALSTKIDKQVIKEMLALNSEKEMRLTYEMLNGYEKASVWKNHLKEFLDDKWTTEQEYLIQNLINKIEPSVFNVRDEKFMNFAATWLEEANKHFDRDLVASMVTTISPKEKLELNNMNAVQESESDCGCKVTNDVLTLCGGIWSASEKCVGSNCIETSEFCGFLLLEKCDGRCENV